MCQRWHYDETRHFPIDTKNPVAAYAQYTKLLEKQNIQIEKKKIAAVKRKEKARLKEISPIVKTSKLSVLL